MEEARERARLWHVARCVFRTSYSRLLADVSVSGDQCLGSQVAGRPYIIADISVSTQCVSLGSSGVAGRRRRPLRQPRQDENMP